MLNNKITNNERNIKVIEDRTSFEINSKKKTKLENELNDIHKEKIQGAYIRSLKLIGLNMTEMYILLS